MKYRALKVTPNFAVYGFAGFLIQRKHWWGWVTIDRANSAVNAAEQLKEIRTAEAL